MSESEFEQVPFVQLSQLEKICENVYGIKASSIQPMQGYIDRNYLIHNAADNAKFVLKISRLSDSTEEQRVMKTCVYYFSIK